LGSSLKKRTRTKTDLEKEIKSEAIAFSLDYEIRAWVVRELGGKEHNDDYTVIRNRILDLWNEN
jgi:hypothetical protein